MTGNKKTLKQTRYHTGYMGHLRTIPTQVYLREKPEQYIFWCVNNMLPKNLLRNDRLKKLQIYRSPSHPHHNIIPNIIPQETDLQDLDAIAQGSLEQQFDRNETKVLYESGSLDQFKDYQREIDPQVEIPFENRDYVTKLQSQENQAVLKKWKKMEKLIKRYRDAEIKPYKKTDPNQSGRIFMVKSEKHAIRNNLQHLIPKESDPEVEDETKPM